MPNLPATPVTPDVPQRTQPSTFQAHADKWLSFMVGSLSTYLTGLVDFTADSLDDAEANANAANLSGVDFTDYADDWLFVNEAGDGVETRTAESYQIATQPEAEIGDVATKVMTPLRTKQAMDAAAVVSPWVLIATKTANNVERVVFNDSDFDHTKYVDYMFRFRNIRPKVETILRMQTSDDNGVTNTQKKGSISSVMWTTSEIYMSQGIGIQADEPGASGIATIFNFHEDKGAPFLVDVISIDNHGAIGDKQVAGFLQRPSSDSPLNYVDFFFYQNQYIDFASGSISLYGRRI